MPTFVGTHKAGRALMAACLGVAGLVFIAGSADAQEAGRREQLRTPTEKSFLNPGTSSLNRNGPGYVVDGMLSGPAYGSRGQHGGDLLPPAIGGGYPLVGGGR